MEFLESNEDKWLSVHIYYANPWEELLTKSIYPFIHGLVDSGQITKYFFIRYWERGPHIRLRLAGNENTLDHEIKPKLVEHFLKYFKIKPSRREQETANMYPNDTLQFIAYDPEIERYGGLSCIGIAETNFMQSSNAIFEILSANPQPAFEDILGQGLLLNASFIYEMEFTDEQLKRLFENMLLDVDASAIKTLEAQLDADIDSSLKSFAIIWNGLKDGDEFDLSWVESWRVSVRDISKQLRSALIKGKNIDASDLQFVDSHWNLYGSLLHMNNNRLGIHGIHEAYQYLVIRKGLSKLLG